jgi:hypothetical protein
LVKKAFEEKMPNDVNQSWMNGYPLQRFSNKIAVYYFRCYIENKSGQDRIIKSIKKPAILFIGLCRFLEAFQARSYRSGHLKMGDNQQKALKFHRIYLCIHPDNDKGHCNSRKLMQ